MITETWAHTCTRVYRGEVPKMPPILLGLSSQFPPSLVSLLLILFILLRSLPLSNSIERTIPPCQKPANRNRLSSVCGFSGSLRSLSLHGRGFPFIRLPDLAFEFGNLIPLLFFVLRSPLHWFFFRIQYKFRQIPQKQRKHVNFFFFMYF